MDKKDAIKLGDIESKFMDPDYSSDNILKFKIKNCKIIAISEVSKELYEKFWEENTNEN